MFSFLTEFLYSLQLLEGDGFSTARRGQDFSLCHYQLHRWALHGARAGPSRGLTLLGGLGEGFARSAPIGFRQHIEQPPVSSDCMLRLRELSILYLVPMFHFISSSWVQRNVPWRIAHPVIHSLGTQYLDRSSQSRNSDLKLSRCVLVPFFRWNRMGPFIQNYTKKKIFRLNVRLGS